jgi:hypothetical protein
MWREGGFEKIHSDALDEVILLVKLVTISFN